MNGPRITENHDTTQGDAAPDAQLEQLERARHFNDERLKSRFEHIFAKYGHDFSDVGDEIDLRTGEIVVNNGHLERMQNEADPGTSASSRFLRTFQENLEHESDEDSSDEADSSEEDTNLSDEECDDLARPSPHSARVLGSVRGSKEPILKIEDFDDGDNPTPFNTMARPAPRLAHLLMGQTAEQPIDLTTATGEFSPIDSDTADVHQPSSVSANGDILRQIPNIQDSISALTSRAHNSGGVDESTIQALGASIANQLASLMSRNSNGRSKKRRWRRGADPRWDYPEIDAASSRPRKRPRTPDDPAADTYHVSPNGHRSLWAVQGPGRPRKRFSPVRVRHKISAQRFETNDGNDDNGDEEDEDEDEDEEDDEVEEAEEVDQTEGGDDDDDDDDRETLAETYDSSGRELCGKCGLQHWSPGASGPNGETLNAPCSGSGQDLELVYRKTPEHSRGESYGLVTLDAEDGNKINDLAPVYSANTSRPMRTAHKNMFTVEEEALIIRLKEQERLPWEKIVSQLEGREIGSVTAQYDKYLRHQSSEARRLLEAQSYNFRYEPDLSQALASAGEADIVWSAEKDQLLLQLRQLHNLGWAPIAARFPGQTVEGVQERYRSVLEAEAAGHTHEATTRATQGLRDQLSETSPSKTSGLFTVDEDALIVHLREVEKLEWCKITERFPGRTESSVRSRYTRELCHPAWREADTTESDSEESVESSDSEAGDRSSLDLKPFRRYSADEDAEILRLREVKKLNWKRIAERLPGRTPMSIRSRYGYLSSKRVQRHAFTSSMSVDPQRPNPHMGEQLAMQQQPLPTLALNYVPRAPSFQIIPIPQHLPRAFNTVADEAYRNYDLLHPGSHSAIHNSHVQSTPFQTENQNCNVTQSSTGKRSTFSRFEDDIILQLKEMQGMSWEAVNTYLPGRTKTSIISRYFKHLRRQRGCRSNTASTGGSEYQPHQSPLSATAAATLAVFPPAPQPDSGYGALRHPKLGPHETVLPTYAFEPITIQDQPLPHEFASSPSQAPTHRSPDPVIHGENNLKPLADLGSSSDHSVQQQLKSERYDGPKYAEERRRFEAPLLRQALDNSLRRQSNPPLQTHDDHVHSMSEGIEPGNQRTMENRATPRRAARAKATALYVAVPSTPKKIPNPASSHLQTETQENDIKLSLQQNQELTKAVAEFSIKHGNPHWSDRVRHIRLRDPSDSRLKMLLDVVSADGTTPQQLRIFEDVLSSNPLRSNTADQRHVDDTDAPQDSAQQSLELSPGLRHDGLVTSPESLATVPQKHLPGQENQKGSSALTMNQKHDEISKSAINDQAKPRPAKAASLRYNQSPRDDETAELPVERISTIPINNSSPATSGGLEKAEARPSSSPLNAKTIRPDRNPIVSTHDSIREGSDTSDNSSLFAHPYSKTSTVCEQLVTRQATTRKLKSKNNLAISVAKTSVTPAMKRKQSRTFKMRYVPDSEASDDDWVAMSSSDSESINAVKPGKDEQNLPMEPDARSSQTAKEQPLTLVDLAATGAGGDVEAEDKMDYFPTSQPMSKADRSPASINRPLRLPRRSSPSTPAAARSSSSRHQMAAKLQTPAHQADPPRIGSSNGLTLLKSAQISQRTIGTPTNIVVHRSTAGIRSSYGSGVRKRVVETPMRDLGPGNSEDELA